MVDLSTVLQRSDVVSLHARLTPETTGLIDVDRIAAMTPHLAGATRQTAHRAADLAAAAVRAHLEGTEPRGVVGPAAGGAR